MAHRSRLIGLIGGMSWESTALYFRLLNEGVNRALGGHHNARSVIHTLDFAPLLEAGMAGRWDLVGEAASEAARSLEAAGAELILITSNTGHAVADQVRAAVGVPLLHIADATGDAVRARGLEKLGFLGTRFTMEMGFYAETLRQRHGIDLLLPEEADKAELHRIIIEELTLGELRPESRARVHAMAATLGRRGAEGVVIGCTELPLLMGEADYPLPAFDTTRLHVEAAIRHALG